MVTEIELAQQLMSPAFFDDPYPTYKGMRDMAPALFLTPINGWVLTGFDEAYTALRRHDVFSSTAISGQGAELGADQVVLISDDQPRHTHLRSLVNKAFTPRRIKQMEPRIASITDKFVSEFQGDIVDVVDALSVPLPVTVIAELMGIDPTDRERFKRWSDAVIAENRQGNEDVIEMGEYFARTIAARRATPASDLFTDLVQAEVEGSRLQDWEIMGFAVLLLVAGNETTTNLISNMLNILAGRPELWQRLRSDRSLVEPVIEETLRIDSPVQVLQRRTLADVDLNGARIPKDQLIYVSYAAANRDPRTFAEPDEFRLDRDLSRHIAFGYGIHFCLGAPLARTEASLALNALLDRYATVEHAGGGERQRASLIVRGFTHLPLHLTA